MQSEGIASEPTPATLRIAVLDRDSGFLQVLDKRLERVGWERRVLGSSVAPRAIVPMRLSAVIVDLGVIGPSCRWSSAPDPRRLPSASAGCALAPMTG